MTLYSPVFALIIGLDISEGHIEERNFESFASQDSSAIFFDKAIIL
jgi:hypothetical protein